MLEYKCEENNIKVFFQEESYTSKASALDFDTLPVKNDTSKKYHFSGKRVKRGLYRSKEGFKINADLNGALNIYRKFKALEQEPVTQDFRDWVWRLRSSLVTTLEVIK